MSTLMALTEEQLEEKVAEAEMKGALYHKKYEEQFQLVADSYHFSTPHIRPNGFNNYDAFVLGNQFEQFETFRKFCEGNATAGQLGELPTIALDLIAASYAMSVAPLISSVQTIDDVRGLIYFKQIKADDTRADLTAGDDIVKAREGYKNNVDRYASEKIFEEVVGATDGVATVYNVNTAEFPVRNNQTVNVRFVGPSPEITGSFVDNGDGTGSLSTTVTGVIGVITYLTGAMVFTFDAAPDAGDILVSYCQDFELSADIPRVDMELTSELVEACVLALKMTVSTFKSFQLNKRFGKIADDEALNDLAGLMANIESVSLIKGINAQAVQVDAAGLPGSTAINFTKLPGASISEFEHRQAFKFRLAEVNSSINQNSGRGLANRYIADHIGAQFLESLAGWTPATPNIGIGAHVFGFLNGIPVIRSQDATVDTVTGIYLNPQSPFEAPQVMATFMPVFITNLMQFTNNPFQNMRAIGTMKDFKSVVFQFVKKVTLT